MEEENDSDLEEASEDEKPPKSENKPKSDSKNKSNSKSQDADFAAEEQGDEIKSSKDKKDKKKKKKKAAANNDVDELDQALADLGLETTEKDSAAQKKKEKKERQKQKQAELDQMKKDDVDPQVSDKKTPDETTQDEVKTKKGKKKKGDDDDQDDKDDKGKKNKKGPGSKMKLAMQEALKEVQEKEERLRKEEEERIRKEEEAEQLRLEMKRLEEEKKAAKKERERLKKEQLRKEGKLLTKTQKEAQARAQAMLQAMREQGMEVPEAGVKKGPRPGTRIRNKAKSATPEVDSNREDTPSTVEEDSKEEIIPVQEENKPEKQDEEKDSWEDDVAESWDDVQEEAAPKELPDKNTSSEQEDDVKDDKNEESGDQSEDESDGESDESSDESDSEEDTNEVQRRKAKAIARIKQRREDAEKNRTTDVLRAGVVCVLGHVDTGKTKILDKLRRTSVQDGEAGGITQQIGATNVPQEIIRDQCKMVKDFPELKIPGLLIIDTPGHESFANLRDRGSSLCDIAILVIDIMHGLEPQTIESISLLKQKKTPFIIALNKIDRLYEWKSNRHKDVEDVVNSQSQNTQIEFKKRAQQAIVGMAEQGLNAALYYENPDPKTYISMVPTSAISGEGMGNLIGMLVKLSQTKLAKRLAFSEELQATVLEVKAIPGLGTTIDICLVNGTLREGQTMILAGTEGPIITPIKALLTPQKMQDLRVKVSVNSSLVFILYKICFDLIAFYITLNELTYV